MTGTLQIGRTDLPATGFVEPVGRVGLETERLRATVRTRGRNRDEIDYRERAVTLLASDPDGGRDGGSTETDSSGLDRPTRANEGVTPDE